jgi:hypothetical protein
VKETPIGDKKFVEFSASAAAVKTTVAVDPDDALKRIVSWASDDQIKVWWDGGSAMATSQGSGTSVKFAGEGIAEADIYYASYPAGAATALSEGELALVIPASQDGSFASANISVAKTTAEAKTFQFYNASAVVAFSVSGTDYTKAVFRGNNGETLAGSVPVSFSGSNITLGEVSSPATQIEVAIDGSGDYYFAVLPVTLSGGFSIALYKGDANSPAAYVLKSHALDKADFFDIGAIDAAFKTDLFVTPEGRGNKNGKKWENAIGVEQLRVLLQKPEIIDGVTFHMADGAYYLAGTAGSMYSMDYTDYGKPVTVTFDGGYPGTLSGTTLSGRDTTIYRAAFTGNNEAGILDLGNNTNITFEGITFKDASADGSNRMALRVHSSSETAKVTLNSCRFIHNVGPDGSGSGAAIKLNYCDATISNCYFQANHARNGSSIQLDNAGTHAHVEVSGCTFWKNTTANTSGAVQNAGMKDVTFSACAFNNNSASSWGGVFHTGGSAVTTFNNCTFTSNSATAAGVMSIQGTAGVTCNGCTFTNNTATKIGGSGTWKDVGGGVIVLRNSGDAVTLDNCTFTGNSVTGMGGVVASINSNTVITATGCKFDSNNAGSGWGSAIHLGAGLSGQRVYLDNCLFKSNTTTSRGVIGINNATSLLYMNRVTFKDNTNANKDAWGVAVQASGSVVCMNNVTTMGNHSINATPGNTVVFNADSGWLITNSTLIDDTATALVRDNGTVKTTICNNVFINTNAANNVFVMGKGASYFDNRGHNVLSCDGTYNNAAPVSSDLLSKSIASLNGSYSEEWSSTGKYGVYAWSNGLSLNPATQTDVENAIKSFNIDFSSNVSGVSHVGNDFWAWLDAMSPKGFVTDGRGVSRNGNYWPGAYQNNN